MRASALRVRYPRARVPALDGLDLDLPGGADHLVVGPSGGGKSTLLRVAAGVIPEPVHAELSGSLAVAPASAYLQQRPADQLFLPDVEDEVAFVLENHAAPLDEILPRVRAALLQVGALHLLGRDPATLSGGEAQRVALASVLVADPALLLLDEPVSMLDPVSARAVGRLLDRLRASARRGAGPATLLVEHRLDLLESLPRTTTALGPGGRVLAQGPTIEVLAEHAHHLEAAGCWLPLDVRVAAATSVRAVVEAPLLAPALEAGRGNALLGTTAAPVAASRPAVLRARRLTVPRPAAVLGPSDGPCRPLLDGVDLDVRAGSVTAVLGANGAGKSTLLRALAGLAPGSGSVEGERVAYVPQDPEHHLLTRSVRAEVTRDAVPGTDVDSLLDAVGLLEHADRDPFRLSGGQQRLLGLAAVAASRTGVVLLDEPTGALDLLSARAVARLVHGMRSTGRAVVMVTHDLVLAAEVADQAIVLGRGRVMRAGPVGDVVADVVRATVRDRARGRWGLLAPPLLVQRHLYASTPGIST